MRLTNDIRDKITQNIIKEIPGVDNQSEIDKLVKEDSIAQLPKGLQDLISKDAGILNYLQIDNLWEPFHCVAFNREYKPSDEFTKKIKVLYDERKDSRLKVRNAKRQIGGVLQTITTVEKLIKEIPEFERHIPDTSKPLENLPVTKLIADLLVAGWNGDKTTKNGIKNG